jgi:hypothetical protein
MIPQRNLSLLANRLATEGGRRIPESVLERDYCLAWFLAALAESDLMATLVFKGGTALKRCYFGDFRFSEDLDFTLIQSQAVCPKVTGIPNHPPHDPPKVELHHSSVQCELILAPVLSGIGLQRAAANFNSRVFAG